MGDMCICSGPPDIIAMGATTVMIGDSAGESGGGGAGGGGGVGATAAKYSAAAAESLTPEATALQKPFLAAQVVCGGTTPVAKARSYIKDADGIESHQALPGNGQVLNGRLQSEGESEIAIQQLHSVRWSKKAARVGEEVTVSAAAPGLEDGTEVMIRVEQLASSGEGAATVFVTTANVSGESVRATWAYGEAFDGKLSPEIDQERPARAHMPAYRAEMIVAEIGVSRGSGVLTFQD
jgi:hypothetical protein